MKSTNTLQLSGRIDSVNAAEWETKLAGQLDTEKETIFDAAALEYISSAGLRVLLKIQKSLSQKARIVNVSPDVYEILEVTGFSELFDVTKRLRKVSVDGCEVIGQGGNGTVYRIDRETIIKVYNPGTSMEKIALEKKYAREAFKNGIPTAISFDTVEVGDRYGIVFELLNATTVGRAISDEPDRIKEYGTKMGQLLRILHTTDVPSGTLPTIREKVAGWIDYMEAHYLEAEDAALLRNVLSTIPERNTILHCDVHEGNVMVQDGELILIDLDDICTGHPVFDLVFNYMGHVIAAQSMPQVIEKSMQLSPENALKTRETMLKTYFGTDDKEVLAKYDQVIGAFPLRLHGGAGRLRCQCGSTHLRIGVQFRRHPLPHRIAGSQIHLLYLLHVLTSPPFYVTRGIHVPILAFPPVFC